MRNLIFCGFWRSLLAKVESFPGTNPLFHCSSVSVCHGPPWSSLVVPGSGPGSTVLLPAPCCWCLSPVGTSGSARWSSAALAESQAAASQCTTASRRHQQPAHGCWCQYYCRYTDDPFMIVHTLIWTIHHISLKVSLAHTHMPTCIFSSSDFIFILFLVSKHFDWKWNNIDEVICEFK